jgi:4-diphosphocytidyl-2-C-methyl-D-erythritol kinase
MIAWEAWLPAPAKLNLFLHVVGRRADGYHLLQTLFRFIDLCDQLRFVPRDDDQIILATQLDGVEAQSNLVLRAARALRERALIGGHKTCGVTIELDKRIPMGGGLGGGSSDAATVLIALNALWGLRKDQSDLASIGLALGADVPVFVRGRNAFAEGIGECLTPVVLKAAWYVVLTPQVSVSTREIFADVSLTRDTERTTIAAFFAGQYFANDLEPVVRRRYPEVAEHLEWLGAHGRARMSGSGSCVFAEFPTEQEARSVLEQLAPSMRGFAVRGLPHHPLATP